jgi:hypothetical protein
MEVKYPPRKCRSRRDPASLSGAKGDDTQTLHMCGLQLLSASDFQASSECWLMFLLVPPSVSNLHLIHDLTDRLFTAMPS